MDVPEAHSRGCLASKGILSAKGERKCPLERAFQCSLAKRATVSLLLLANLIGAVGFAHSRMLRTKSGDGLLPSTAQT